MARPSGGFVWAVLLVLVGAAATPGNGLTFQDFFWGFPKVRVICKQNPDLSLTNRNGRVVLEPTRAGDQSQMWFQDTISTGKLGADDGDGCRKPFALVNFNFFTGTAVAIVPSDDGSNPVQLVPYKPFECVPLSTQWNKGRPLDDGYHTVNTFKDDTKCFNGLGGGVRDGTVIGALNHNGDINDNILFKFVNWLPNNN